MRAAFMVAELARRDCGRIAAEDAGGWIQRQEGDAGGPEQSEPAALADAECSTPSTTRTPPGGTTRRPTSTFWPSQRPARIAAMAASTRTLPAIPSGIPRAARISVRHMAQDWLLRLVAMSEPLRSISDDPDPQLAPVEYDEVASAEHIRVRDSCSDF